MDIQKEREAFEEAYAEICKPIIRRPYPRNQNGEYVYKEIHEAHLMWQQAQKVAVPEGFKLVPIEPKMVTLIKMRKSVYLGDDENGAAVHLSIEECKTAYKAMITVQEQVG